MITRYDAATGKMECDTYHLTDFGVVEYESLSSNVMPAILEKIDVFKPLAIGSTTPVVIMIIIAIAIGVLVPVSLVFDKIGEEAYKKEQS